MNARPSGVSTSTMEIRSALITGSSGGIGEATARRLAAMNIAVAIHGRQEDRIRRIVVEIERDGGRAVPIVGDLAQDGMPEAIATQASAALSGIDLVVNNAAQLSFGALEEFSLREIKQIFDVNVFAAMAINKTLLPEMRKRGFGRIVNVSSVVGWLHINP
jgi:3-oxoacyl-[acyl-carrier protein] reductase